MVEQLKFLLDRGGFGARGKHRVEIHHIRRESELRQPRDGVAAHERHAPDGLLELRIGGRPLHRVGKKRGDRLVAFEQRDPEPSRSE